MLELTILYGNLTSTVRGLAPTLLTKYNSYLDNLSPIKKPYKR